MFLMENKGKCVRYVVDRSFNDTHLRLRKIIDNRYEFEEINYIDLDKTFSFKTEWEILTAFII